MEIKFKLDNSTAFSHEEKNCFLDLLNKQGKVYKPTLKKIGFCPFLCIATYDNKIIGIGALKNIYKTPFTNADVAELTSKFKLEVGYLYVENNYNGVCLRGLGIGKTITRLLIEKAVNQNLFATTELNESNPMLHILLDLGFKSIGRPYVGHETGDIVTLMVLIRE
jgi:hypothetical protein